MEISNLIKEARFPGESLSVTDEDWEKALYSTVETKQYNVVNDTFNITIDYPYFEEESKQVSSLIETFIMSAFNNDFSYTMENLEEDEKLTVDIDYEIENYDSELLSIVFTGHSYVYGAAYPQSLCYAVTINLENKSIVTWENYYKDASEILNLLGDGKYQVLCGGLKDVTSTEVCEKFESELQKGIESNDLYFYIKDGKTYFVITTLIHAMGDYSIVLIGSQS